MISSLTLERFRGFKHAHLPLKPLTVLLGPNSAGKSSFLQALAALHFIRRLRISPPTLAPVGVEWWGWPLDFGTQDSLQLAGSPRTTGVRIALRVDTNAELAYEFGFKGSLELSLLRIVRPQQSTTYSPGAPPVPAVTLEHVLDVAPGIGYADPPLELRRIGPEYWQLTRDEAGEAVKVSFENLKLQGYVFRDQLTYHEVPPLAQETVFHALDGVRYMHASRVQKRLFQQKPPGALDDYVGPAGEWAAQVWLKMRERRVKLRPPPSHKQLNRQDAIALAENPKQPEQNMTFEAAVDLWAAHLGIAKHARAEESRDTSIAVHVDVDGEHRSLADVGYGVSQALPILVQGLALPEGGTLLVEQPEAQLHPRPQAHLADFFCSLVEQGRNCIVETHSESFFRRLHLRALLDPELLERIAVYFLDPVGADGCCDPIPVPLGRDAAPKWPKEFLAESVESYASFAAVRAALGSRRGP